MILCKIAMEDKPACGKEICCHYCDEAGCKARCHWVSDYGSVCPDSEEVIQTELQTMNSAVPDAIKAITEITLQMEKLKEQEAIFRKKLLEAMEQNGVKKFENDRVSFTYVAPTTKTTFDKKAFQTAHPEIDLGQFDKVSKVSASVRIKVK